MAGWAQVTDWDMPEELPHDSQADTIEYDTAVAYYFNVMLDLQSIAYLPVFSLATWIRDFTFTG